MNKNFQKSQSRNATMDSISTPDIEKIDKLNDPKFHGRGINRAADEIFEGEKFKKPGEFDRATKLYNDPVTMTKDEIDEDDYYTDFVTQPVAPMKEQGALDKGVKVGKTYVKKKNVVVWIVVAVVLLIVLVLFCPPIATNKVEDSKVLYERNVFEDMGMTEFKAYALANYSVWNEAAFSSEKKENYRVVQIAVNVNNPTPFEVSIPQFEASKVSSDYTDSICYVTSTKTDSTGAVVGETIPAFSSTVVNVEVMVNVTNMTDADLDEAITGIVLSTSGMKKRIAASLYLPCIPNYIFVSDTISVNVNP